jgi:RHS repeat-associated protein
MWTWHYDGLLNEFTGRNSKHVYLGESRIVTKISRADGGSTAEERIKQYYYHSDHLGSAQVISNADGQEYERIEYTPYGELWIEKASMASNIDIPYRFTGKERDEETGLYYYGARYLDSKASRWLSADPALGDYIPGAPVDDEARKRNQSLPGMGGVFNLVNLHLYHYAGNNPVKYVDPDGKWTDNEDGTFTAESGDTLWGLYGADWQEKSEYTGDPTKLQIGETIGEKKTFISNQQSQIEETSILSLQLPSSNNSGFLGYSRSENITIGVSEIAFSISISAASIIATAALAPETTGISALVGYGGITMGSNALALGIGRVTGINNRPITDDIGDIFLPVIFEIGKTLSNFIGRH